MKTVDDYIATLTPAQQGEFERIKALVNKEVALVEQGTSYAMPAFMHKGKALLSIMVNKNFLSLYPFSGKVIEKLKDKLVDFEQTTGSIHFSVQHPIPEALLQEIIETRLQEIESNL